MRIGMFAAGVCVALLGTVALAQSVSYDYDRAANFSQYQTYAWTGGTELIDELSHARVVRAIDATLSGKGLVKVDRNASPDALVAYHANFDKNLEITGTADGWGPLGLGGNRWGSARVQPVLVGTLVVDIADARTSALIWRSVASSDVHPNDKPKTREGKITKAAQKMFKDYPPEWR